MKFLFLLHPIAIKLKCLRFHMFASNLAQPTDLHFYAIKSMYIIIIKHHSKCSLIFRLLYREKKLQQIYLKQSEQVLSYRWKLNFIKLFCDDRKFDYYCYNKKCTLTVKFERKRIDFSFIFQCLDITIETNILASATKIP